VGTMVELLLLPRSLRSRMAICRNVTEGKAFSESVFTIESGSGTLLLSLLDLSAVQKNVKWNWGIEQNQAMDTLKTALTTAPAYAKYSMVQNGVRSTSG